MQIVPATVVWQKNDRGDGVVAFHERVVVFPAKPGLVPPMHTGGAPAVSVPGIGEEQTVVLIKQDNANNFFAYPPCMETEVRHGYYFVTTDEGLEVVVAPAWDCHRVIASEDQFGNIHIVVVPEEKNQ